MHGLYLWVIIKHFMLPMIPGMDTPKEASTHGYQCFCFYFFIFISKIVFPLFLKECLSYNILFMINETLWLILIIMILLLLSCKGHNHSFFATEGFVFSEAGMTAVVKYIKKSDIPLVFLLLLGLSHILVGCWIYGTELGHSMLWFILFYRRVDLVVFCSMIVWYLFFTSRLRLLRNLVLSFSFLLWVLSFPWQRLFYIQMLVYLHCNRWFCNFFIHRNFSCAIFHL